MRRTDKFNVEWGRDLWDIEIDLDEALRILQDFDFSAFDNTFDYERELLADIMLFETKVLAKSNGLVG